MPGEPAGMPRDREPAPTSGRGQEAAQRDRGDVALDHEAVAEEPHVAAGEVARDPGRAAHGVEVRRVLERHHEAGAPQVLRPALAAAATGRAERAQRRRGLRRGRDRVDKEQRRRKAQQGPPRRRGGHGLFLRAGRLADVRPSSGYSTAQPAP
jgi:hypothetical protein